MSTYSTQDACHDCNNITQHMCPKFKPKHESIKAISEITRNGFLIKSAKITLLSLSKNYSSFIILRKCVVSFRWCLPEILLRIFVFNPIHEIASNIKRTTKMVHDITVEYLLSFSWSSASKVDVASNSRLIIVKRGTVSLSCDCIFFMDEKWMSKKALTYGCLQSGSKVSSVASL